MELILHVCRLWCICYLEMLEFLLYESIMFRFIIPIVFYTNEGV